jgi:hypothetical protein
MEALAQDGIFKFSAGVDYSTGDYGLDDDTDIWYVPFTFKYDAFPWLFRLTVPWLRVEGPGGVVVGADGNPVVVSDQPVREVETHSGLGDIVAGITYSIAPVRGSALPFIDFTGKIKFGTADEDDGLGTGANDYILQVDLAKTYGNTTPLGTLGYKFKGDADDFELDNVWFASLGFSYKLNPAVSGGITLDWQEASTDDGDDQLEAVPFVGWKFDKTWSLSTYGVVGFSEGSPDWGLGAQVTYAY